MNKKIKTYTFLVGFAFIESVSAMQYSLIPIGDLPGGTVFSIGHSLNINNEVAGRSLSELNHTEAFSWSPITGIQGLGYFDGGTNSWALGNNDQGSVVGYSSSSIGTEAFLWNSTTGLQGLGDLPGGSFLSVANGVNNNNQVVGSSATSAQDFIKTFLDPRTGEEIEYTVSAEYREGYIWDSVNGMVSIGNPLGAESSGAVAINDNGVVTVATSVFDVDLEFFVNGQGYIWDATNGFTGLGDLPGGDVYSTGSDINSVEQVTGSSGSTIVGSSGTVNVREAFIWDATNGIQGLGILPGGGFSAGRAVNDDGVVVGTSTSSIGSQMSDGYEAFIWQPGAGMVSLNGLVDDTATGWFLSGATDINNNGVILGYGKNPLGDTEAYLLVPLPPVISADLAVTQYDNADPVSLDSNVTYTVRVTNNGPVDATNVKMLETFPQGATLVGVRLDNGIICTNITEPSKGKIKTRLVGLDCAIGEMVSGSATIFELEFNLNVEGENINRVSVNSDEDDPDLTNNISSETTTVEPTEGKPCKGKKCN